MGIKSKAKSAVSKVKSAATNYAKNVVGGAKIVAGAVSSAGKKVGGSSQSGNALQATTLPGAKLNPSNLVTGNINLSGGQVAKDIINKQTATSKSDFNPLTGGGNISNAERGLGADPGFIGPAIDSRTGKTTVKTGSSKGTVLGVSTLSDPNYTALSVGQFGSSPSSQVSNLVSNTPNLPSTNVINTPTLGTQNTKLTFNEPAPQDFSSLIPAKIEPPLTQATTEADNALKNYLKELNNAPDSADAYAKAQRETGILEKQQLVSDLTGQLNAIVSKGQANQLSLVGQGRGIPEAIIGGQQAQIGRETAIAALPVQAQLSAAQGNLEMANDNLDTLFKIYSDDARNEFEARREQKKMVYEIASAKEKRELDKLDKAEERAYQEKQQNIATSKSIAIEAAKNGAPATVLSKIANAVDLGEAITSAGKYMQNPLDIELKKAQIAKAWADAKKVDVDAGQLTEAQLTKIDASPQGKKLVSLSGLYQKSQTYKNLVDLYGFKSSGVEKSLIDRAYADLKISYKTAAELGALTGPDVALLEEAIKPSAGGALSYLNYKLSGGKGGISTAVNTGLKKAKEEALMNYKQLTSRNPSYGGSEYVRSLISPFAVDYNTVNLNSVEKGEIIQTEDGILLESLGNGQFTPI